MKKLDECKLVLGMGTIIGAGVVNLLGNTNLSMTEVLLREAVQNSYDARIPRKDSNDKHAVEFNLNAYEFSSEQFEIFTEILSGEHDNSSFFSMYIRKNISKDMLNIEVSDRNTIGLIGDIEPTEKTENQNFANFVYYTGAVKAKETDAGGAFGFGKSSFYVYSKARTIVVYSRICINEIHHAYQSRFIVISSDERIQKSIDRCWWGVRKAFSDKERGFYAAPVVGEEADELAHSIGMTPFGSGQTGTSILIVNASPEILPKNTFGKTLTMEDIFCQKIPRYIVHWYWNKLIVGHPDITFGIKYKGNQIEIDDPRKIYPYSKFVQAYARMINARKAPNKEDINGFKVIKSQKPKVTVGYASVYKTPVMPIKYADEFDVFDGPSPVVAYMRGIGHIVFYEKIRVGSEKIETTCYGVFKTDREASNVGVEPGEIDRYFRAIETPEHDNWIHKSDTFKWNYLKTAKNDVTDLVKANCIEFTEPEKSTNISVLIQRTLGEKLMPHIANVGTPAGARVSEPSMAENSIPKNKGSMTYMGETDVFMGKNDNRYVSMKYKISVRNHPVRINSITPKIITIDQTKEDVTDGSVVFSYLEIVNSRDKSITRIGSKSGEITRVFEYSQTVNLVFECNKDCSFSVDTCLEEVKQ